MDFSGKDSTLILLMKQTSIFSGELPMPTRENAIEMLPKIDNFKELSPTYHRKNTHL